MIDTWPPPGPPKREPLIEHLATFSPQRGPSGRELTCAAYRVATSLELRAEYGPEDIASTKLCRDDDADEQIAATADAWRLTLIAKGFREIAKV